MTPEPQRHDEVWELLSGAALDALEPALMARVMAHVRTCDACATELAALREAAAQMALVAPRAHVSAARRDAIRDRLVARARAQKSVSRSGRRTNPAAGWRRSEWMAATAGVLLVVSLGVSVRLLRDRSHLQDALRVAAARTASALAAADSLHAVVAQRDRLIAGVTGRDMAVITLTANAPREAWALMFWNRATNGWTFVAHNLPQPVAGRTYQLWLVTAAAKISVGTFTPARDGEAVVRATYALPRTALKAVAVTDEPAGGVPQPTGPFVVVGVASSSSR